MPEELATVQKPEVFITNIVFNDGKQLSLAHNSIVVFTGANNCGKSQVLKDIERSFDKNWVASPVVLSGISQEYIGTMTDSFINTRFYTSTSTGELSSFDYEENTYRKDRIIDWWERRQLHNNLHKLFVRRIDTERRLITSNALLRTSNCRSHPIYKLHKSEDLSQELSAYFRQAFGVDIIVNRDELSEVPLHIGNAPDAKAYTMDRHDDYFKEVTKLPRIDDQGDGMRSFASILLNTFTSENTITLIDEPEAFLHPPQARLLGKMLSKNNPSERQLLISTHSEDFLQGLLDADNENVTVIHINRQGSINHMNVLENAEIKKLWGNPLLRYSNILSGLFHEKVIVCESDYDCLFYQAIMDAMYESKGETSPDILFTHCGGKARMKDVVRALKAVAVPVVAVPDFDIIINRSEFRPLIEAFGAVWDGLLSSKMKTVFDWLNADPSKKDDVKHVGKSLLGNDAYPAYETVDSECQRAGLFVVPHGEIECFDKTINKQKREWVYAVLERGQLHNEARLEDARKFVQALINFK